MDFAARTGCTWPVALAVLKTTARERVSEPEVFRLGLPGENGYWPSWNGGEYIFTRTSPNLPRPQIVEPR